VSPRLYFGGNFTEATCSCLQGQKSEKATKKFKKLRGSFPDFALSSFITFSQTLNGATVPLKEPSHQIKNAWN
jgi:hypothetical protein